MGYLFNGALYNQWQFKMFAVPLKENCSYRKYFSLSKAMKAVQVNGAMTITIMMLSITTFSIMTLSITINKMRHSA
jgi:hypothetical protein